MVPKEVNAYLVIAKIPELIHQAHLKCEDGKRRAFARRVVILRWKQVRLQLEEFLVHSLPSSFIAAMIRSVAIAASSLSAMLNSK